MSDPRIDTARVRARITQAWVATLLDQAPTMVRRFVHDDLPWLFGLIDRLADDNHPPGEQRLLETVGAQQHLATLVHMARLADDATETSADPLLWRARESDLQEGLRGMCDHRLRLVVEAAVRELSATGWNGDPTAGGGLDADVNLQWREPER